VEHSSERGNDTGFKQSQEDEQFLLLINVRSDVQMGICIFLPLHSLWQSIDNLLLNPEKDTFMEELAITQRGSKEFLDRHTNASEVEAKGKSN
jgi:hypothetical protein